MSLSAGIGCKKDDWPLRKSAYPCVQYDIALSRVMMCPLPASDHFSQVQENGGSTRYLRHICNIQQCAHPALVCCPQQVEVGTDGWRAESVMWAFELTARPASY